jgi:glycolate oxidase iron-sulfur subunit
MVPLLARLPGRLGAMARLARVSPRPASVFDTPQVIGAQGDRRKRVALLTGCVQRVIAPEINDATIRLLTRHGCEVVIDGLGCAARCIISVIEISSRPCRAMCALMPSDTCLDAVVANASGCGTTSKPSVMPRLDPALAADAAESRVSRAT